MYRVSRGRLQIDDRRVEGQPKLGLQALAFAVQLSQRDGDVAEFVTALRIASTEFEQLWQHHTVAVRGSDSKRMIHPEVGQQALTPAQ